MEWNIKKNLYTDFERVKEFLSKLIGFDVDMDAVKNFVNTEEHTVFYLDSSLNIKDEADKPNYAWIDTGYIYPGNGMPIFLSLYRDYDIYTGYFLGTSSVLSRKLAVYNAVNSRAILSNTKKFDVKYEKRIAKRTRKHLPQEICVRADQAEDKKANDIGVGADGNKPAIKKVTIPKKMTPVTKEIFEQLLIKNWSSIEGLDRYIKVVGKRIMQLIDANESDYFELNNIRSAIVNTGLIDQFGADILVLYKIDLTFNMYIAAQVMYGKRDWIENGYEKEQTGKAIKPVYFVDADQKFRPDISQFDINRHSLYHIIDERRERFPEDIRDMSDLTIATKLQSNLEMGLKMQQRDCSYAKPYYNAKTGAISWMMPLHINREFQEEPELVMVIRKAEDFYEICTILPYDDHIKDNLNSLSLYNKIW